MRAAALAIVMLMAASVSAAETEQEKAQPAVTLDVKDADVREVLKSMQKQCGVRNLIIDKEVSGAATFYFNDVPCDTAFRVVTRTLGLAMETYENSVITVGARRN